MFSMMPEITVHLGFPSLGEKKRAVLERESLPFLGLLLSFNTPVAG